MAEYVLGLELPYEEAFSIYLHGLDLSSGGTYADIHNTRTSEWKNVCPAIQNSLSYEKISYYDSACSSITNTDEFHNIQEQLDNNIITLKITFRNEV